MAVAGGVVVAVGTLVLLLRPWLLPVGTGVGARVALFAALGVVGLAWPLRRSVGSTAGAATTAGALAVGILAFGLAWALDGPRPPVSALGLALALNALAAVAEEAFFRRLAFGWLQQWGPTAALVGSAALFAAAHVTVWGVAVLPLDLAAGLLLSWQRALTGRWSVPAVTHVVANTFALL